MYNQKPTTSLMEDLKTLGLVKQPRGRRLNENDDEMEPDGDEGGMPPGMGGPPAGAPAIAPPAPPAPPAPAAHGEPDGDDGGMPPQFRPKPKAPAPNYDMYGDEEGGDEEMQSYESAWNVVKQYYALQEGKEKLSEDDYKTVVNAMSFIIETQGKYLSLEPDHDPDELPGGLNPAWAGNAENNPSERVDGTNAMRKLKGWRYHDASPRPSEKAESLNGLVGELKALTQQTESNEDMQDLGNKIIEGFEAIRDTAGEVAQGLASELRESSEKVTASHPRVRLGKYFEGVAGDAKLLLKSISENNSTDVDDAIEDLNSLSRDLKRGLAQL